MSWFSTHPHAAAASLAGILLIIGAIIVESRTAVRPGTLTVWGGTGAPLLNPSSYSPSNIINSQQVTSDLGITPIYIPPSQGGTENETRSEDEFDFNLFISAIAQPIVSGSGSGSSLDLGTAYSFVPRGLIATSTPAPSRTDAQQQLYTYGNDAASYIQTYEDSTRNAPNALRDQAEDRQNGQKIQAVRLVASSMTTAGESLLGMEEVPVLARSAHVALAESYIEAGRALAKVPDAQGDEAFVAAIGVYNAAADTLVKNYVDLSIVFSLAGVTFSSQDPGSIFTFSGGAGL